MTTATVTEKRHAGQSNEPVELARYTVGAGNRVIRGQRVLGVVRLVDVPARGEGPSMPSASTAPDVSATVAIGPDRTVCHPGLAAERRVLLVGCALDWAEPCCSGAAKTRRQGEWQLRWLCRDRPASWKSCANE